MRLSSQEWDIPFFGRPMDLLAGAALALMAINIGKQQPRWLIVGQCVSLVIDQRVASSWACQLPYLMGWCSARRHVSSAGARPSPSASAWQLWQWPTKLNAMGESGSIFLCCSNVTAVDSPHFPPRMMMLSTVGRDVARGEGSPAPAFTVPQDSLSSYHHRIQNSRGRLLCAQRWSFLHFWYLTAFGSSGVSLAVFCRWAFAAISFCGGCCIIFAGLLIVLSPPAHYREIQKSMLVQRFPEKDTLKVPHLLSPEERQRSERVHKM